MLALATCAQRISAIHIIYIEKEKIILNGFNIEENDDTITPVIELRKYHRDITNMNYKSLGNFASLVLESLKDNRFTTFDEAKLRHLIIDAIDAKRLNYEDLREGVQRDLKLDRVS